MEQNRVRAAGSWVIPVNVLLGLWLIVGELTMPGVFGGRASGAMLWNDIVTGILVLACCGAAFNGRSAIPFWIQCALAAWLLIAPMVLPRSFANEGLLDLIIGLILAVMSLAGAVQRSAAQGTPNRV